MQNEIFDSNPNTFAFSGDFLIVAELIVTNTFAPAFLPLTQFSFNAVLRLTYVTLCLRLCVLDHVTNLWLRVTHFKTYSQSQS